MARAVPILLLAAGEIVLAAVALRVAVWVALGWRARRSPPEPPGGGPGGPGGGLRLVRGGAAAAPPPERLAA